MSFDYRIGPRETKVETYTWDMPDDIAFGPVRLDAVLKYQRLVTPVAEFLKVPAEEYEPQVINVATTTFEIYE